MKLKKVFVYYLVRKYNLFSILSHAFLYKILTRHNNFKIERVLTSKIKKIKC